MTTKYVSWRFWLALISLLLSSSAAHGQVVRPLAARVAEKVDSTVQAEMQRQEIPGLALGIISQGRIVYLKGYGVADLNTKQPVTRQTMFRWASLSKPVTAVAAMQLAEKGKLDLDADVRKYVPEFPDKGVKITTRHLLCHQSGIVHYKNGPVIVTQRQYDVEHPFESVILALDTFKESPLVCQPGEKFSYSSHAYILLSAVVERAGEEKFADQIAKRISKPLQLTTLQADYQWVEIADRSKGYRRVNDVMVPSPDTDVSWKLAGGGFISNVDDMAKFVLGMIQGKLVSERTAAMIATPQPTASGEATSIGLGFLVTGTGQELKLSHDGAQDKVATRFVFYPNQRHGMVLMCNGEHAKCAEITTAVYAALK